VNITGKKMGGIIMGIGYLLGRFACLLYTILVGYFGGIKKSLGVLRLAKMKLTRI